MRVLEESTASAFATTSPFPAGQIVRSGTDREVAANIPADGGVILVCFTSPCKERLFCRSSTTRTRSRRPQSGRRALNNSRDHSRAVPSGAGRNGRGGGGASSIDHHAMMVRRRIAAGVGVVLLIAIVLLVNGCLKRGKQQALESYNQNVNQIAAQSESQVAKPCSQRSPPQAASRRSTWRRRSTSCAASPKNSPNTPKG